MGVLLTWLLSGLQGSILAGHECRVARHVSQTSTGDGSPWNPITAVLLSFDKKTPVVQVFKYMHLHEYMQGRGHSVAAVPGTLGSGSVSVRDKMRSLHLPKAVPDPDVEKDAGGSKDAIRVSNRPFSRAHAHTGCLTC